MMAPRRRPVGRPGSVRVGRRIVRPPQPRGRQYARAPYGDGPEVLKHRSRPGTPEGVLSRKVSNRAGLLFALVSLECSVEGGAVDVEHLGEVVEVHAGVE